MSRDAFAGLERERLDKEDRMEKARLERMSNAAYIAWQKYAAQCQTYQETQEPGLRALAEAAFIRGYLSRIEEEKTNPV